MAPKLEDLKGCGGSVRVGTTGTIGSLITKELDKKLTPQTKIAPKGNSSTAFISVPCDVVNSPKKLQPTTAASEASGASRNINYRQPNSIKKTKNRAQKNIYHTPIFTTDSDAVQILPNTEKVDRKVVNLVEVVDIRCGTPSKWTNPIANLRFKKLTSSKFSETIV